MATHLVGQLLRLPGIRLTRLLDTTPLPRTVAPAIDRQRLRDNITGKGLTLAVVTTSGTDDRAVVFVDRDDCLPVPGSDDEQPLDYVAVHMQLGHVLASCAIPMLFSAVRVCKPSGARGWHLDGGYACMLRSSRRWRSTQMRWSSLPNIRCVTPRQHRKPVESPAMSMTSSSSLSTVSWPAAWLRTCGHWARSTPCRPKDALVATATGRLRKKIPYVFVGPAHSQTSGRPALEVLRRKRRYTGALAPRLRQLETTPMAHALKSDGPRRGDLVSYLYFDQEFIRACIDLGQRDANAVLTGLPANDVPWRVD